MELASSGKIDPDLDLREERPMKKRVERSKVGVRTVFQIYGNWERERK
ncbi:hypothetical protein MtrunA17_Chr3g0137631 [Medicago truncatula]|uniref:Uncharacterized protein n=1 Tax=Medicago truncatula TaxID=3880 RepID=A0A396IY33_MEDTR|nr:hypothetical protein MtrunA17_Chr3g0137631 [Medicago truncatula]